MSNSSSVHLKRPFFFENWQASAEQGASDFVEGCEFPLYSDAWMTGEERVGPYHFINTIAHASGHTGIAPVMVIRAGFHVEISEPKMDRTDTSLYHGGALSDEVAALAALAIGARVKAGPTTRQFSTGDSRGRPVAYWGHQPPVLPRGDGRIRLPRVQGSRFLGDLQWLGDWVDRDPRDEIALIRSARLYQEALWIGDAEPALAWLLLVSAVETVADRWYSFKVSRVDRLRDAKPRVVQMLEENCPSILANIADELADSVGSTRKFVEFIRHFLPPAPTIRPPEAFQVEWEHVAFAKMLRTIYAYRSKALHTGVPFPAPMCDAPIDLSGTRGICERPVGLAMSTMGAVWLQKDTPMLLHIFAYLTREVLKAWWSALKPRSGDETRDVGISGNEGK